GMPDVSGEPVVTTLVCLLPFRTRDCGCIVRPAFPTPSSFSGVTVGKARAFSRREIGEVCWLRSTSPRLRGEVRDGAQRRIGVRGTIRKFEPVENPPHPLARCS